MQASPCFDSICCLNGLQANNVSGSPTFSSGATYFQTHANTAPEAGCTFSACTPFEGVSPHRQLHTETGLPACCTEWGSIKDAAVAD